MAVRVQVQHGANGSTTDVELPSESAAPTAALMAVPERTRRVHVVFWKTLKIVMAACCGIVIAEGERVLIPALGWKLYHAIYPLYYLPWLNRVDLALLMAFGMMAVVLWVWDKLLRLILGLMPRNSVKWFKDGEALMLVAVGAVLLACDAGLFYCGLCGLSWGGSQFSLGALLATLSYVCLMIGVSYAAIDAKRITVDATKWVRAAAILAAVCLPLPGCTPPEGQVFGERQTEYVLTVVLDVTESFADDFDGAWRWMEATLDRYFRDRAGSADDLIVIANISGNGSGPLWQGTPRDLRRQFPTPEKLRDFVLRNVDPSSSRVHESIIDSLDYMLADPNVGNGNARSALFVLSDLLANSPDKGSESELARALSDYGKKRGVVGMYFVHPQQVPAWKKRLQQSGVRRYVVSSRIDQNPPAPSFE